MDVFGAGNLRLDHAEVLTIRHGLCLDSIWLGGRRYQVRRVLGAVNALREALIRQSLHKGQKRKFRLDILNIKNIWALKKVILFNKMHFYKMFHII